MHTFHLAVQQGTTVSPVTARISIVQSGISDTAKLGCLARVNISCLPFLSSPRQQASSSARPNIRLVTAVSFFEAEDDENKRFQGSYLFLIILV